MTSRPHRNRRSRAPRRSTCAVAVSLFAALLVAPAATADPPDKPGKPDNPGKPQPPDPALAAYGAIFGPPTELDAAPIGKDRVSQEAAALGASAVEGDIVAAAACWVITWKHGRGAWPYNRNVHQRTTWCGNGSKVTYRSSIDWPSHGPACYVEWGPRTYRVGGGVGTFYVDVKSDIGYGCTFVAFDLHDIVWMTIRYNANGNSRAIAWS
jgi:hypothetical protein